MDAGRLLQYGPTAEVFHRPQSMAVARAFSDPPMNVVAATATADGVSLPRSIQLPIAWPRDGQASGAITLGIRASALRVRGREGDTPLPGTVELAEISGSDTFVHVDTPIGELVAQLTGVHDFTLGAPVTLYLSAAQVYLFDAAGALLLAPERKPH